MELVSLFQTQPNKMPRLAKRARTPRQVCRRADSLCRAGMKSAGLLLLLVPGVAQAQDWPRLQREVEADHARLVEVISNQSRAELGLDRPDNHHKKRHLVVAALVGSAMFDGITTRAALTAGAREGNPLIRPWIGATNPVVGVTVTVLPLVFAEVGPRWSFLARHPRLLRALEIACLSGHLAAGTHNLTVP